MYIKSSSATRFSETPGRFMDSLEDVSPHFETLKGPAERPVLTALPVVMTPAVSVRYDPKQGRLSQALHDISVSLSSSANPPED